MVDSESKAYQIVYAKNIVESFSDDEIEELFKYFGQTHWKSKESEIETWEDALIFFITAFTFLTCKGDANLYVTKYFHHRGLLIKEQSSDVVLGILKDLINKNEKAWKDYTDGKEVAKGRFVGQLIKLAKITSQDAVKIVEEYKNSNKS